MRKVSSNPVVRHAVEMIHPETDQERKLLIKELDDVQTKRSKLLGEAIQHREDTSLLSEIERLSDRASEILKILNW